jgi:hypothetical protein
MGAGCVMEIVGERGKFINMIQTAIAFLIHMNMKTLLMVNIALEEASHLLATVAPVQYIVVGTDIGSRIAMNAMEIIIVMFTITQIHCKIAVLPLTPV